MATELHEGVHLVQPAGHTVDRYRPPLLAYGPVTGSVLESLRLVGLRELNADAENLMLRNGSLSDAEATLDRLPTDPFERGLEIWRALALWSRIAEDVASMVRAIQHWRSDGFPGYVDCRIGEEFLRWVPSNRDRVVGWFEEMSVLQTTRDVLLLPNPADVQDLIGRKSASHVESLCARTARDTSAWFGETAGFSQTTPSAPSTDGNIVWRRRRPASCPCISRTDAAKIAAAEEGFGQGFSVIDWAPSKAAEPELIVWGRLAPRLWALYAGGITCIEMLGNASSTDSLRFADPSLPVIPLAHLDAADPQASRGARATRSIDLSAHCP